MLALHRLEDVFSLRHIPSWMMLAFSAGSVNAGAYLACDRFVTHVTGTATKIGLDVDSLILFLDYALVLICFIIGAIVSSALIDGRYHRNKKPLYAVPLLFVTALLGLTAMLGEMGVFGDFGGTREDTPHFLMLSILSFAMGMQNAAVATSTGLVVRTTHLTGPATDFGVNLVIAWTDSGEIRKHALQSAALRGGKIIAFISGAACMLFVAREYQYAAFMMPSVFVLLATSLSIIPQQLKKQQAVLVS